MVKFEIDCRVIVLYWFHVCCIILVMTLQVRFVLHEKDEHVGEVALEEEHPLASLQEFLQVGSCILNFWIEGI